jgi:hypothetical protein
LPIDADGGHPADESGHVLADGAEVPAHALADWLQGVTCARPASNCGLISATPAGSTRETVVPTS